MKQNLYQFFLYSSLVMLGWNLSMALALIVIIFLSIFLQSFGIDVSYTSIAFIFSAVIAGALGLGAGIKMGINAKLWFTQRNPYYLVVLWTMLIGVTLMMFPGHYNEYIFSLIS